MHNLWLVDRNICCFKCNNGPFRRLSHDFSIVALTNLRRCCFDGAARGYCRLIWMSAPAQPTTSFDSIVIIIRMAITWKMTVDSCLPQNSSVCISIYTAPGQPKEYEKEKSFRRRNNILYSTFFLKHFITTKPNVKHDHVLTMAYERYSTNTKYNTRLLNVQL